MRPRRGVPSPSSLPAQWNTRRCIPSGSRRRIRPIARLYEVTFKEFRVCVRAIFAFAGGYKLGERYLLGELERRLLPLRLALRPLRQALRYPWLCAPSVDPSGDLRTSRQSVRPVLGGIGLEFPDHAKLRR